MHVVIHPEAAEELEGAAQWYEERQAGLGDGFLNEFERTLRRIVAEPERWRIIRGDNRKLNFERFPYAIVYSASPEAIRLKAVMRLIGAHSTLLAPPLKAGPARDRRDAMHAHAQGYSTTEAPRHGGSRGRREIESRSLERVGSPLPSPFLCVSASPWFNPPSGSR